jgi:hypothetical protein
MGNHDPYSDNTLKPRYQLQIVLEVRSRRLVSPALPRSRGISAMGLPLEVLAPSDDMGA